MSNYDYSVGGNVYIAITITLQSDVFNNTTPCLNIS